MQRLLLMQRQNMTNLSSVQKQVPHAWVQREGPTWQDGYLAGWKLAFQVVEKGTHGRRERRPESVLLGAG